MAERKKILWLSDHPLIPSGVGIQAKYAITELLKTEQFQFYCLGGAIKHQNYDVAQVAPEQFGEGNWLIKPTDGHGDKETLRRLLNEYKPDAIVLFTDPRFFYWVWEIEDEVRRVCPIVYWHVWDNDPLPDFNRPIYEATDYIMSLSLKTYGIMQGLGLDPERHSYVPHAEPADLFKPLPDDVVRSARKEHFGPFADREFIVMWNNRNARRKMTGDVIESFNRFAKKVGRNNCALLMHTQAADPEGQDINAIVRKLGLESSFILSESRISPEQLNMMYNCSDCVINISNNEGFGLGTLEALYAGTPIVVNMTGGLQFQIGDWWCDLKDFSDQEKLTKIARSRKSSHKWWGVPVYPATRNMVGSQAVPYIFDDRVNNDDVAEALEKVYRMGRVNRKKLGLEAREWATKQFGMDKLRDGWVSGLNKAINSHKERRDKMGDVRTASL